MLSPSTMTLSLYSTGSLLKPHSPSCVPGRTSQSCLPSASIVRGHDDLVADAEGDVDPLAVGGRRAGGVAVLGVDLLQRPLDDGLLPEDLARGAIEAQQHALEFLRQGGDREDAVAPDDRRGVPAARARSVFQTALANVPVGRHVLLQAGAVAARTAPAGPVFTLEQH